MYIVRIVLVVSALALIAGCSPPPDGDNDGEGPADAAADADPTDGGGLDDAGDATHADGGDAGNLAALETAWENRIRAFCERLERCDAFTLGWIYEDVDDCVAGSGPLYRDGISVTVSEIESCTAALDEIACDDSWPDECNYTGDLAAGEPCFTDMQCVSGDCDRDYIGRTCGVCAPLKSIGDDCIPEGDCPQDEWCLAPRCNNGLVCHEGLCVGPARIGDSCEDRPCDSDGNCIEGTCVADAQLGEECGGTTKPPCDFSEGLWCVEGECIAIEIAAEGESCDASGPDAGFIVCGAGLWCDRTNTRTCVPGLDEGAMCEPARQMCKSGLGCGDGTCQSRADITCR